MIRMGKGALEHERVSGCELKEKMVIGKTCF